MIDVIQGWMVAAIFTGGFAFMLYACVCLVIDDDWDRETNR